MAPIRKRKPHSGDPIRRTQAHNRESYGVVQKALSLEYQKRGRPGGHFARWCRTQAAVDIRASTLAECNRVYDQLQGGSVGRSINDGASTSGAPKRPRLASVTNRDHTISESEPDSDTMASSDVEAMDEENLVADGTDAANSNLGSGHSRRSASGGAAISLGQSGGGQTTSSTYHKSRIWYSYAYAQTSIPTLDEAKTITGVTTPLALIPVDLLSFYLSPQEWHCLHANNTWVDEVTCTVRLLGVRSGFDTGATTSGTATTEYCPLLHTAVGLNNALHILNKQYTSEATKPMVPTAVASLSITDYHNKWYNDVTSNSMGVARSNSVFAVPYWNCHDQTDATNQKHIWGNPRLDKVLQTHLLTSMIGETLFDYSYKPRMGLIKPQYHVVVPNYRVKEVSSLFQTNMTRMKVTYAEASGYTVNNNSAYTDTASMDKATFQHAQTIEKYMMYSPRTGTVGGPQTVQPQLHLGMQAIPQLNPSTDTTNFTNACIYYSVDCSIKISHSTNSMWTAGSGVCSESAALFNQHRNFLYEDPHHAWGKKRPNVRAPLRLEWRHTKCKLR